LRYDAVIAGGSFGGLVLATSLKGRVALVEKGEVGEGQTSACGTTLDLIQKLGLEESIEEVHDEGVMHVHGGVVRFTAALQLLHLRLPGLLPAAAGAVRGAPTSR